MLTIIMWRWEMTRGRNIKGSRQRIKTKEGNHLCPMSLGETAAAEARNGQKPLMKFNYILIKRSLSLGP